MNLNLREGNDYFKWHLHKSGIFSVRSMYRYLVNNGVKLSMEIWQTKLPLKIKTFLWYLKKGVLLTKDNLGRRNWHGDKSCCFCGTSETIQHLFLDCSYAKFLWRTVYMNFGIGPPQNIHHMFNGWGKRGGPEQELRDYARRFGSQETKLFLTNANQNLSGRTYWLRLWTKLQRSEWVKQCLLEASCSLETVALQLFSSFGWPYVARANDCEKLSKVFKRMCWALWLSGNDIVFDTTRPKTFLQVFFREIYWLWLWIKLQQNEDQALVTVQGCRQLENRDSGFTS
ncbi:hypothetical protein U9M48_015460, partial [Paspalum notatum var. saurae]